MKIKIEYTIRNDKILDCEKMSKLSQDYIDAYGKELYALEPLTKYEQSLLNLYSLDEILYNELDEWLEEIEIKDWSE